MQGWGLSQEAAMSSSHSPPPFVPATPLVHSSSDESSSEPPAPQQFRPKWLAGLDSPQDALDMRDIISRPGQQAGAQVKPVAASSRPNLRKTGQWKLFHTCQRSLHGAETANILPRPRPKAGDAAKVCGKFSLSLSLLHGSTHWHPSQQTIHHRHPWDSSACVRADCRLRSKACITRLRVS